MSTPPPAFFAPEEMPWIRWAQTKIIEGEKSDSRRALGEVNTGKQIVSTSNALATTKAEITSDKRAPSAPTGLTATSVGSSDVSGQTLSFVTLEWQAVVLSEGASTDPVQITDPVDGTVTTTDPADIVVDQYEVWMRPTSSPDEPMTRLGATADIRYPDARFLPGSDLTFAVRARSSAGVFGPFSEQVALTTAGPAVLDAPTAPVVTSGNGVVVADWGGSLVTGPAPAYLAHVYAEAADTATGTYTAVGSPTSRAGSIVITGLPLGSTKYIHFIAVDTLGRKSVASAAAAVTVTGVNLGSLESDVTGAIQSAQDAGDAGKAAAADARSAADTADAKAAQALLDASNAQSAANSAAQAASDATATANQASNDAATASGLVASKGRTWIQGTAPTGAATDLWIDTTGGANTPKKWDGSVWVAVTDKAATDAAAAAVTAKNAADAAQSTADTAKTNAATAQSKADSAFNNAATAQGTADTALSTANGKNKVIFSTSAASGTTGYVAGDIWFQKSGSLIVAQWEFTTSWQPRTLDSAVIANLDAGKITAGYISSDRIAANSLQISKVGGLQTSLDSKETPAGASAKADAAQQAAIDAAALGAERTNQWLFSFVDGDDSGAVVAPAPDVFAVPGAVRSFVTDGANLVTSYSDTYRGALRTMIRVDTAGTISFTATHDDSGRIFLDGAQVYRRDAYSGATPVSISFPVAVGWHVLDLTWVEHSGGDGWYGISPTIGSQVGALVAPSVAASAQWDGARANALTENWRTPDTTTIDGGKITANSVTAARMVAGTITAASGILADAVITNAKIADLAVNNAKINDVSGNKITARTITADRIGANQITANEIAAATITANEIKGGTITGTQLSGTAIDGKTITGAVVRTAASGARVELTTGGLKGYDASSVVKTTVGTDGKLTATDANITGAINATSGTISGALNVTGSLTGGTVRTATSGQRVELSGYDLRLYNSNNALAGSISGKVVNQYPQTTITSGSAWLGVGGNTEASDYAMVSSDSANFTTLDVNTLTYPARVTRQKRSNTAYSLPNASFGGGQIFLTPDFDCAYVENTAPMTMTVKVAGLYRIRSACCMMNANNGTRQVRITLNGTDLDANMIALRSEYGSATSQAGPTAETMRRLAVGDVIRTYAYQSSGGSLTVFPNDSVYGGVGNNTFFEMEYLGS